MQLRNYSGIAFFFKQTNKKKEEWKQEIYKEEET